VNAPERLAHQVGGSEDRELVAKLADEEIRDRVIEPLARQRAHSVIARSSGSSPAAP
jgi:hypothetical protein